MHKKLGFHATCHTDLQLETPANLPQPRNQARIHGGARWAQAPQIDSPSNGLSNQRLDFMLPFFM